MSISHDAALLVSVVQVATDAHKSQTRKQLSPAEAYICHPARVAFNAARCGMPIAAIGAAYLHDVVEDTRVTMEDLQAIFHPELAGDDGERMLHLVSLLTKWWGDSDDSPEVKANKEKYYTGILSDPDAIALKLLDRADNLRDMIRTAEAYEKTNWPRNYLRKTQGEFLNIRANCVYPTVVDEFDSALEALRETLAARGVIVSPTET